MNKLNLTLQTNTQYKGEYDRLIKLYAFLNGKRLFTSSTSTTVPEKKECSKFKLDGTTGMAWLTPSGARLEPDRYPTASE